MVREAPPIAARVRGLRDTSQVSERELKQGSLGSESESPTEEAIRRRTRARSRWIMLFASVVALALCVRLR